MILTEEHVAYENDCRNMFIGQTICGVIYGEINYCNFDDVNIIVSQEPSYMTKYQDIDTLDHSIYFKTNNKTIYIFWDSTFFSYGLLSKEIDFDETTNDYEQKWDVSKDEKWIRVIGHKIVDFKIIWEKLDSDNIYPQAFTLETENKVTIIISASEFKGSEQDKIFGMSDNLLVTMNLDLARELKMI